MAQTGTVVLNYTIGGTQFSSVETRTAEGAISQVVTLPAGQAGLIDVGVGVDGLETGHGISGSDVVDVHWVTAAGVHEARRGLVVDTAGTNDITYDETPPGIGDTLPANDYPVVVGVQVVVNMDFTASEMELLAVKSSVSSAVDFWDAAGSELAILFDGNDSWFWIKDFAAYANPLDSDIVAEVNVSNGSTSAGTVNIALLYQSVP